MTQTPAWLEAAQGEIGVEEIVGPQHNARVVEYFAAAGHGYITDDETAWCSAYMNWVFSQVGIAGTQSLAARSWLDWGNPLSAPRLGAVMVFSRGDPNGWQGHVGLYVGEDATHYQILGGNQSNSVKVKRIAKTRLLGIRWPATATTDRTNQQVAGTLGASVGAELVDQLQGATQSIAPLATTLSVAKYALIAIGVVCAGLIVWNRIKALRAKHPVKTDVA